MPKKNLSRHRMSRYHLKHPGTEAFSCLPYSEKMKVEEIKLYTQKKHYSCNITPENTVKSLENLATTIEKSNTTIERKGI